MTLREQPGFAGEAEGKSDSAKETFLADDPNCYFGALGGGQGLVTGAKPCFHMPARVFMPIGLPRGLGQELWWAGLTCLIPCKTHKWAHVKREQCARWKHQESEEMFKS